MHIETNIAARRARLSPAWGANHRGAPEPGRPAITKNDALSASELRRIVRDLLG